jgi:hypothetical protein
MQHHPDRGGDCATMQAVNSQYKQALSHLDGTSERGTDGQPHVYHYNEKTEEATMQKLYELLRLRLPDCEIWLIGSWIWVQGDTKPSKDALKGAGCVWHAKRLCWYWRPTEYRTHYNARCDLAGLAAAYGAKLYTTAADPLSM